jgi:hypothetical protein
MATGFRYIFTGVIHPERAAVNVSMTGWELQGLAAGISGKLSISIAVSQLLAVFDCDTEVSDISTLKNHVGDAVRVVVDAFGYLNGCGYDVEIVQLVQPDRNDSDIFGVDIPALRTTEVDRPAQLTRMMGIFRDAGPHTYKGASLICARRYVLPKIRDSSAIVGLNLRASFSFSRSRSQATKNRG